MFVRDLGSEILDDNVVVPNLQVPTSKLKLHRLRLVVEVHK